MDQVRFISVSIFAIQLMLFVSTLIADVSSTAEVELSSAIDAPIRWRLVGVDSNQKSNVVTGFGRITVPVGIYHLEVATTNTAWFVIRRLELEDGKSYRIDIYTGINLKGVEGVSSFQWSIRDANRQVAYLNQKLGFVPLPEGAFTVELFVGGQSNSIKKSVTVTAGEITNIDVGTGVLVNANAAPVPQSWTLMPVDSKGQRVNVQRRWGVALAAPGDYWLVFQMKNQGPVQYQRVTVRQDEITAVDIHSGFQLESEIAPEFYRLVSPDQGLRLQSSGLDTLFAPPGVYSLSVKMRGQQEVLYEKSIKISPHSITKCMIDSGVQVQSDSTQDLQVSIHQASDNTILTHMNSGQGFIPAPAGKYKLFVKTKDQSPIEYQDLRVEKNKVVSATVSSGIRLQVAGVFGVRGHWTFEPAEGGAVSTVVNWGKAYAPANNYTISVNPLNGPKVIYGEYSVKKDAWLNLNLDSGLQIDIGETKNHSVIKIYRQGEKEYVCRSNLEPSYIPLPPGQYQIVQEARDGYVWGQPFTVRQGTITRLDEGFLSLAHSTKAKQITADNNISGFNIAKSVLGGRVINYSSQNEKNEWNADNVVDGFDYFENLNMAGFCEKSCGWMSQEELILSPEITIGFHQDREAWIKAIIIDNAFISGINKKKYLPKHISILVSKKSPDTGFVKIVDALLEPGEKPQLIELPDDVQAKYVKVRVLSTYGGDKASIGEIGIIESTNKPSIITDLTKDLARPENGGSLAWFSSQAPGKKAAQLVWQGDAHWSGPWHSFKGPYGEANYLPQDIVFGFYQYKIALIDYIVIDPTGLDLSDSGMGLQNLAKEVVIEGSMSSPVRGFTEIARIELVPTSQPTKININQKLRFIKLRIVSTHGKGGFVKLGRVSIIESNSPGGESILRGTNNIAILDDAGSTTEIVSPSMLSELEPNDDVTAATRLITGQWVAGVINPLGEQDYYLLTLPRSSIVTTDLSSWPFIQNQLDVKSAEGDGLYRFLPNQTLASQEQFSLKLNAGDYYYHLTQATNSIVLVWDTSGSMKGSEQDLERAVMGFIDHIRPSEKMMLIRFSNKVEILTDGFTNDIEQLKQIASDKFTPDGGTSLYDAIVKAMGVLDGRVGNKVIVLMTDGKDTVNQGSYAELWYKVRRNGIRIYTVGLGESLEKYSIRMGATGQQLLDYLAMATAGKNWHADESDELESLYQSVSKEITSQAAYQLRVSTNERLGLLDLSTRDKLLSATISPRFEIILDASGSMVSTRHLIDGQLKIDVAKKVLVDIVNELPDSIELGFRVFGHRIKEYLPGDCQDTELVYSIKQHGKDDLRNQIHSVVASDGTTPLSYSILQAAKDLINKAGRPHVVLVTDGQEYCGADPASVVRQLMDAGINIRIDIVGMDLKGQSLIDNMQTIANMTQGEFYNIQSGETFVQAIQSSLGANYKVKDAAGKVIAHGVVNGRPIKLPHGTYDIAIEDEGELVTVDSVKVSADKVTRVDIVKNGHLIEPSAVVMEKYTRVDWQSAKEATIFENTEQPMHINQKLQKLEQLEQQIIAAEVNRPSRSQTSQRE